MRDWQQPLRDTSSSRALGVDSIIVPIDGTEVSKVALPVARTLARLENATVHVVYVGDQSLGPKETAEQLGLSPEDMQGVVLDRLTGDPREGIVQLSHRLPAALIVMCTHTENRPRLRSALGSVARAVLESAPPRIVLVPPERGIKAWVIRRVLLAHDGTPKSDCAIAPAAELAYQAGAEALALHIASTTETTPKEPGSMPAPRYVDQPQHEWPAWAGEFVDRMMALGAPAHAVNFKLLVKGGQPGSEVAQFARENGADIVVIAWAGRWEQRPSAIRAIVRRSGCPVLLICTPQQRF
jgi:nucleotide-binding universal stress UspA family protein